MAAVSQQISENEDIKKYTKMIRINCISLLLIYLSFLRPVFAYMNTWRKTPLEIHFIYLGKSEIY